MCDPMTTPTDYPDRVRALVADAGPEDWHFDSGYEEIDYYRRQPAVVVRTDIGSSQVASGYDIGQVALMAESKRRRRLSRERAALQSPAHPEFAQADPAAVDAETWRPIPTTSTPTTSKETP